MRFHIYFNWLMTEEDYRSHMEAEQKVKETRDPQYMLDWEPTWYPHLEFQNAIEEHRKEWELYPEEGRFRKQKFKDFGKKKKEKIDEDKFDCEHARFVRAKLECEMTFAEELERMHHTLHIKKISPYFVFFYFVFFFVFSDFGSSLLCVLFCMVLYCFLFFF